MSAYLLLEVAIKASVVLLAAWAAVRVLKGRSSAAVRHLVWTAALITTLLLPALVVFGPSWSVARVPDRWVSRFGAALDVTGLNVQADGEIWLSMLPSTSHAPFAPGSSLSRLPSDARNPKAPSDSRAPGWVINAFWVWFAGASVALGSLLVGLIRAWWLVHHAMPVEDPTWLAQQHEAAAQLALIRPVLLRACDQIAVPVACGVIRPSLLLPREALSWNSERQRMVLLHELAHVRRHDCFVQAVAHLARALYWFNPLAFIAMTQLRIEQENACDDLVLDTGAKPADDANHLCDIASFAKRTSIPTWAALAVVQPSRLEARVRAILDADRRRHAPSYAAALTVGLVVCTGSVVLGSARTPVAVRAMGLLPSAAIKVIAPYSSLVAGSRSVLELPAAAAADTVSPGRLSAVAGPAQEITAEGASAFLETCVRCHNQTLRTANVVLDGLQVSSIGDNAELWERIVRKVRGRLHVRGTDAPSRAVADAFTASVEVSLDRAAAAQGVASGEPLSQREIAERLVAFLWHSEPDATLINLADRGRLADPATLQQQVRRLLADRRSAAFLNGFFNEWLHLGNMEKVKPDPSMYADFDDDLRHAFQHETELFLASQVRDDRPVTELLTANYTFLNERLARHYGIGNISGGRFRRIALPDDARGGILGQGSVLTVTSFPSRTSPVLRGKYVLQEFLGIQPPPPPPNVPALREAESTSVSLRARMEQHRKNPVCAACHMEMDPFGFALENFDAIGRWRDSDGTGPIDPSSTLADGTRLDGPADLRKVLMDRRETIVRTIALKLLAHALGRPVRYSDMPAVRGIVWESEPGNFKWSSLIMGVVRSAQFQTKAADPQNAF